MYDEEGIILSRKRMSFIRTSERSSIVAKRADVIVSKEPSAESVY
jgi:hypothetical protein